MSDLILSINFDESKKKNRIVLETYEGTIPKLKSKKYSGQLRNVNINSVNEYNNIDSIEVQSICDFLNDKSNIQISKHQYMLSIKSLLKLKLLINFDCLFYKDKKLGMFQINNIIYDRINKKNIYEIEDLKYSGDKNVMYLLIDKNIVSHDIQEIIPKVYIDLNSKFFNLTLKFDYGSSIVDFFDKDRHLKSNFKYRDYRFEYNIQKIVYDNYWKLNRANEFVYTGKNLNKSIENLIDNGIYVYTNNSTKISVADFSKVRVSYDLDWFNIRGEVSYDNNKVNIENLINFKNKKKNWIEYKGNVILIPEALLSKNIQKDSKTGEIVLNKKYVSNAIEIAHDITGKSIFNIDKLVDFKNVEYNIDYKISRLLREYQVTGVKWLLALKHNGFGACLADDMGLGKTLQIIAYLSDNSMNNTRNLIIVPKTLIINWKREIERFSPETLVYIYHGQDRNIKKLKDIKVVISTYQTLVNDLDMFHNIYFDNLIIDEAQYIKNSKSKAYKALQSISASMKILLTGTPIENSLSEFWGLMRLINPEIIECYSSISKNQEPSIDRIKMLSEPFLLRRLKRDVLKDLPNKQEQTLLVKMETEQQKLYDKMLESIRYEIFRENERFEMKSNSIMLNGLLYLQEICCHPQLLNKEYNNGCTESAKLELVIELIKDLYSNGHKVVVFSRFTKMLSIIEKEIIHEHINFYYLDGKTKDRMSVVDEFENSDNGIFLISLKAGGTGINLTSADTAIIYDPWWNPASEKQAEDRIYRMGQKKNVMVYKLIVEGTIEEKIQKLQMKKIKLCSDILDGHEVPMSMTVELMQQLLLN